MSSYLIPLLVSLLFPTMSPLGQLPALVGAYFSAPATFRASERAVSNWRLEAARQLDLEPANAAALIGGDEPRGVGRCVRLNNYWCIKGVGWNGMLAADAEGHVAFSSATEGATVAALLLRRYYLDFSRRTANAIVSRWAPPQCGPGAPIAGLAQRRANLGPEPRARIASLATHGLGNTLRARFLAARRSGKRAILRRSVVPDRVAPLIKAPTIAAGSGERTVALPAIKFAALIGPLGAGAARAPAGCALDGERLRHYAMRTIAGVAASPDEDLQLFSPDGEPRPALARVMENMSAVEIGPFKASPDLVRVGIEAATATMRAARASSDAASR